MRARARNKYNAVPVVVRGQGFRSGLEGKVYEALLLMARAGKIRDIRREQPIELTPSIKHKIDFVVRDCDTDQDYGVEAKGMEDASWGLKKRLYKDFGPFKVEVWKVERGCLGVSETIEPGRYKWERL